MLLERIAELEQEIAFYKAIHQDYCVNKMHVVNVRTDGVYEDFCRRHPELEVSQRKFTRILCEVLGMKSAQGRLDGKRGSFYEYR